MIFTREVTSEVRNVKDNFANTIGHKFPRIQLMNYEDLRRNRVFTVPVSTPCQMHKYVILF